jgi:hypothetical protein
LLVEVSENKEQQQGHNARQEHHICGKAVHGAQNCFNGSFTTTNWEISRTIVSQARPQTQYDFSTGGVERSDLWNRRGFGKEWRGA